MKTISRTARIAAAGAIALGLALPASQAFAASRKTDNAIIGGAIGALAGALISNGDTTATVGGAAAGALIGAAATDDRRHYSGRYDNRYRQPSYAYGRGYPARDYRYGGYRYERPVDYRYSYYGR